MTEAQTLSYIGKAIKAGKLPKAKLLALCEQATGTEKSSGDPFDLFEPKSFFEGLPPMKWLIELIAQEDEITWIGALPKHMKTWFLLSVVKALLSGESLFGDERFKVPHPARRIIYLIPEAGARSFYKRLKAMGLDQYLYDRDTNPEGGLLVRTLSKGKKVELIDELLLSIVEGADVFLDTAIRWLEGDENSSKDTKILTTNIMNLLIRKARSIWCAHHAPKGFENAETMTMQNMFRGSGEYSAALSNAYGLCKINEDTKTVHVSCLGGRDLESLVPDFQIQPVLSENGQTTGWCVVNANAGKLAAYKPNKKPGRRSSPADAWRAVAVELFGKGYGRRRISEILIERGHQDATDRRVRDVLEQYEREKTTARKTVENMQEQGSFKASYVDVQDTKEEQQ